MGTNPVTADPSEEFALLYPDDAGANRFTTDFVVCRCSHGTTEQDSVDHLRTVGDNEPMTAVFEVVCSASQTEVEPESVTILSSRRLSPNLRPVRGRFTIATSPNRVTYRGQPMLAYTVTCPPPALDGSFFERSFWEGLTEPASVHVLGLRSDLEIRSYYPHQYLLEVTAPGLRSVKQSTKVEIEMEAFGAERDRLRDQYSNASPAVQQSRRQSAPRRALQATQHGYTEGWVDIHMKSEHQVWSPLVGTLRERTTRRVDADDISVDMAPDAGTEDTTRAQGLANSVSYEVDGAKVEIAAAKVLHGFLEIAYAVEHWSEVLKDIPKFGWYWDLEASFFTGKVGVGWGWREHTTYQAYLWAGLDIDVTLVELQCEIGIGVQALGAKALVFARIKGSIGIKVSGERSGPGDAAELRIGLEAGIEGVLGARMAVPFLFEVEGTAKTELKLDRAALVFSNRDGFSIAGDIKWTGLKGTLKASASAQSKTKEVRPASGVRPHGEIQGNRGSYERSAQWVDPVVLGSFRWPPLIGDGDLTVDEIGRRIETALYGSQWNPLDNVVVEDQRPGFDLQMDQKRVADFIAGGIDARTDIRKDLAAVDRIGQAVYRALRQLAAQPDQRADDELLDIRTSLTWTRFNEFVTHGELGVLLDAERAGGSTGDGGSMPAPGASGNW